jgi:hypothetical protein
MLIFVPESSEVLQNPTLLSNGVASGSSFILGTVGLELALGHENRR